MARGEQERQQKIVLIGTSNAGKSVIFRLLTGRYQIVSNYPGTTVEVSRGNMRVSGRQYTVIDTPGIYNLIPQSEDEKVTCKIFLEENPFLSVHVRVTAAPTAAIANPVLSFRRHFATRVPLRWV